MREGNLKRDDISNLFLKRINLQSEVSSVKPACVTDLCTASVPIEELGLQLEMANTLKTLVLRLLLKRPELTEAWGRAEWTSPANSLLLLVIREIKLSRLVFRA